MKWYRYLGLVFVYYKSCVNDGFVFREINGLVEKKWI